jgi:hypothetical protein
LLNPGALNATNVAGYLRRSYMAKKAKSGKSVGVRPVGRDGFYSDEPEQKNIKRKGLVYNKATGEHQKSATKMDAKKEWRKMSGTDKAGSGKLAKARKAALDKKLKKAGG